MDLYGVFQGAHITHDIVWRLTVDDVVELGLTVGQKKRYFEAVKKEENLKGIFLLFLITIAISLHVGIHIFKNIFSPYS